MPLPGAESAFLFSCQVINTPAASQQHTQRPKKKASSIKLRKMPSFGQRAARYLGFDLDEPVEEVGRRSPVLKPEVHGSLVSVVEQQPSELLLSRFSGNVRMTGHQSSLCFAHRAFRHYGGRSDVNRELLEGACLPELW
ncbi:hypothetical protein M409DRAFT_57232 [Zasmidium cellare ATCC 36951]|uniref:Uncharacterized protein n=1 Tax=Zasmidium cellare ATCC 36951 TaxID=1080233 RepID=A0A6A6CCU7_ZASCE|nr:uncharacterized protein M409DRAFT_57232 [Zasmidium cellare ATCC 36951]KAF2163742.1 hypothetical protein M409DRAFT_57232 [Zasmidium cellare ATCC 36951]